MIIKYMCLIIMTLLGAVASLFLKKASETSDGIKAIVLNRNLYIGGTLYILSAILNIWLLKYLDYSVVLPLTSLTYVWTMFLAAAILKESISLRKVFGIIFILSGGIIVFALG